MIRIYRPLAVIRLLSLFFFLFYLAICLGLLVLLYRHPRQNLFLILIVGLFLAFLLFSYFQSMQMRIEVSDSGIKYFSGSFIISTSWENLERIGKVPGGRIPVDGLVLKNPSAIKKSFIAKIFSSSFIGYEVDYSRSIPLQGGWSWNWRKSKLTEDIKRYCPDLL
jgi:hypothetical protein